MIHIQVVAGCCPLRSHRETLFNQFSVALSFLFSQFTYTPNSCKFSYIFVIKIKIIYIQLQIYINSRSSPLHNNRQTKFSKLLATNTDVFSVALSTWNEIFLLPAKAGHFWMIASFTRPIPWLTVQVHSGWLLAKLPKNTKKRPSRHGWTFCCETPLKDVSKFFWEGPVTVEIGVDHLGDNDPIY